MQLQEILRRNHFLIHISQQYLEVGNTILSMQQSDLQEWELVRGNLSIPRSNLLGANGVIDYLSSSVHEYMLTLE